MKDSERECTSLSEWECHGMQVNKIRLFVWLWDVVGPAQVSGGG